MTVSGSTPPAGDQLRAFREVLAASQSEFSKITDIGLDSVRAIEGGRRNLTDPLRLEIFRSTGGYWNKDAAEWFYRYGAKGPKPYERSDFEIYRQFYDTPSGDLETEYKVTVLMLQKLFNAIKGPAKYKLIDQIHEDFEGLVKRFKLPGDFFNGYWPTLIVDTDINSGEIISATRQYRREIKAKAWGNN
jgi:hypothetical protein